ncbi:TetR/AcrR family transcriptional regulator [Mycobacterium sp. NPDC003449]
MARKLHDTDGILDAAARLLESGGIGAVTMVGVIREADVPSGSVYHRFPDRPALLAALWNRTIDRYHGPAYPLFENDPVDAAVALAGFTVEWCQAHPGDAAVLMTGCAQFDIQAWPVEARTNRDAENERWDNAIRGLVRRLKACTNLSGMEIALVVVDLPYAAVRRFLSSGVDIPGTLAKSVAGIVRQSLTSH